VSVLPLLDLLILLGWTLLMTGFVQKVIWMATAFRPLGKFVSPMDFVIMAALCLVFALALAARTWVKLNEPKLFALRREAVRAQARERARQLELGEAEDLETGEGAESPSASAIATIRHGAA
jgi:hypothetical protein